ncbi:inosine triphosphate pyrophosphatase [Tilletiaria anomala UBC 951]|uniref:Inosine triphosphate pyrophosphatase n=1 Tax=Tilletiaria anomala (strain ATCC 24038 / CBS 436.72 / UBC 951) TaxID=1037660 RepID=A0A066VBK0_TILAU|nr:inosine triphosphate pyrophosphatase [Tilletiaria anomala UBC 951]KDN36139.1 inosine triphosphate pyrophosphatase [Tilletiaria anomala UBC 951]
MATPLLEITFVTGNANKLREVREILSASSSAAFELVSQALEVPEIQGTTQEVATAKCKSAASLLFSAPETAARSDRRRAVITEDTALTFGAFNDVLPGVYIKDFLRELGHDGLNKMLAGFEDKSAHAVCTFALQFEGETEIKLFEGRTRGTIVPARGPKNFGWDPILEIEATGKTYAEMEPVQKNSLSHRYKALDKLRSFLQVQAPPS